MFGKKKTVPASICHHNVTIQIVTNSLGERGAEVPLYCEYCLDGIVQEAVTERGLCLVTSFGRMLAYLLKAKAKHT